jgi:glutamine amidotransferase
MNSNIETHQVDNTSSGLVALVDHGAGNLRSVQKALEAVGARVMLTAEPDMILSASKVVLPGVGAFADVMKGLVERNLVEVIKNVAGNLTPLLGICVGMQMLFEISEERGETQGLNLLPGRVQRFPTDVLKVPQTGWNQVHPVFDSPLLRGLEPGSYAYFNHSYYCKPEVSEDILAVTEYGIPYASIVGRNNLYGVQFHPEKSQQVGLQILRNFIHI